MSKDITFNTLTIKNYKSIGDAAVSLSNRGLILVEGQVTGSSASDSNGAGKTTIFDSLSWCLFGLPIDGKLDSADDVVNRTYGENCMVSVEFEYLDDDYEIFRYRQHKSEKNRLRFFKNGEDLTASTNKDTQTLISSVIGMDHRAFCLSVIFGQGDPNRLRFTHLRPDQRQEVFEEILQMQWISDINSVAKQRSDDTIIKIDEMEVKYAEVVTHISGEREKIASDKVRKEEFEESNSREIELISRNIKDNLDEIEDLKKSRSVDKLTSMINKLEQVKKNRKKAKEAYDKTRQRVQTLTDNLASAKKEVKKIEGQIIDIKKKISAVQEEKVSECELCGQALKTKESVDRTIEEYRSMLSDKESEFRDAMEREDLLIEDREIMKEQLEEDSSRFMELDEKYDGDKLDDLKLELAGAERADELIPKYEKKNEELLSKIEEIKERKFKRIGSNKRLKKLKIRRDKIRDRLESLEDDMKYYEFFRFATASNVRSKDIDGEEVPPIRKHMIESVLSELNNKANEYADILTDGQMDITVDTGDNNEILVKIDSHDRAGSYKASSGGEKNRANVCITLAMQELVRSRFAKGINLRVFDEVFESLDETGTERVIELLNELAADEMSVFVITHQTHLKSYFDHTVKARWENGVTEVIGG